MRVRLVREARLHEESATPLPHLDRRATPHRTGVLPSVGGAPGSPTAIGPLCTRPPHTTGGTTHTRAGPRRECTTDACLPRGSRRRREMGRSSSRRADCADLTAPVTPVEPAGDDQECGERRRGTVAAAIHWCIPSPRVRCPFSGVSVCSLGLLPSPRTDSLPTALGRAASACAHMWPIGAGSAPVGLGVSSESESSRRDSAGRIDLQI